MQTQWKFFISKSTALLKNIQENLHIQQEKYCSSRCHTFMCQLRDVGKIIWSAVQEFCPVLFHCSVQAFQKILLITTTCAVMFGVWKLHLPYLFRDLNLYDEGVTLMGASRFFGGEIPYLDFFTIYGPLKFSLLGSVFSLFGENLFVARMFFLSISLGGFAMMFLFFQRIAGVLWAVFFVGILALFGPLSLTPFFLICIALWFAAFLDRPSLFSGCIGGMIMGLLLLLRLDFGGFVGLSVGFLLLLHAVFSKEFGFRMYLQVLGTIFLGTLIVVFPFVWWLSAVGALPFFWEQAIVFPIFGNYQELRHLPWQGIASMKDSFQDYSVNLLSLSYQFGWGFVWVSFGSMVSFWLYHWQRYTRDQKKWSRVLSWFPKWLSVRIAHIFFHREKCIFPQWKGFLVSCLLSLFAVAGGIYASHRSDFGHVLFLNVLCVLLLSHLILQFRNRWWGLLLLPSVALVLLFPAYQLFSLRTDMASVSRHIYSFFPIPFPVSPENDDLDAVLGFFDNISSEEKVFVGTSDTSRVFVNNVMLPFLLRQPVGTKYHELHTGIVTTRQVQQEMITEMETVNVVVLWDLFFCEPNKGCESTNVHILDEYIQEHFVHTEQFGAYKIYIRKEYMNSQS